MAIFSQDELNNFKQSVAPTQTAAQPTQPHYAKGLGGFVERNLPTIGGVVGAVATSPLELLDAVTGAGGTALNVAGAAGGASLGQKLENSLTGTKSSTTGAAVGGALGELGGRAVGKVVGKFGSKLATPVDKGIANIAEKKAATTAANEVAPFANVAGGQDVQGALDLMKTHGLPTTPEAMKTAANLTTGQNGEFNATLRQILGGNGGTPVKVNVGGYLNTVKGAINDEPLLGMAEAKTGSGAKLMNSVTKNKENSLFGGEGSLTQNADGNKVLDAIQYHQQQAAKFAKAAPGSEGEAIGNVHKQAADYLNNQLSQSSGADKAVAAHTLAPDEAQAIKDHVESNGGTPQLGQHIVDTINNAKSVQDLRSAQAPFVRAAQLAGKAEDYAKGKGFVNEIGNAAKTSNGGNGFRDLSTAYEAGSLAHGNVFAGVPLAAKATRSEPVVNAANNLTNRPARALNNAPSSILSKLTGKNIPAPTTGNLVSRSVGQETAQAVNNPTTASAATTDTPNSQANDRLQAELAAEAAPAGAGTSGASATDPFSSDSIKTAILEDMQNNGGKNISSLISLYNTFGKAADTQSTTEKNTTDNLNGALSTLSTYADQLNAAGGGKGKFVGTAENVLGKFGLGGNDAAQVRAIESQKTDVATAIAKALTNGKPAASQIKSWTDALPNVTDSAAVAKQKLANITASINARLQTLPGTQ